MTMIPSFDVLDSPSARSRGDVARPALPLATAPRVVPPVARPASAYRRRRVCAVAAVCVLTIVSVIGVGQAGADRDPNNEPVVAATTLVIVQPGDTLWAIAGRVAPEIDRRKAVDQLAEIAGGAQLEVGQRLEIPAISG